MTSLASLTRPRTAGARTTRRPKRERSNRGAPPLWGLIPLVAALALWQLLGHGSKSFSGPPPSEWWTQLHDQWTTGTLKPAIVASFRTFILALAVATVLGTALGALVGRVRFVDRLLGPLLEFCRVMPAAAVVPLAVLFAGYTQSMKVSVVVFTAIWPILLQVRTGARSLDPQLFDVARAMHLGRFYTIRKIVMPALLPSIMLGIRVAAPTVLIIVLLVEIVTGVTGLGSLIEKAQQDYVAARVYGLVALAGVLALVVNGIVAAVEGYVLRYRQQ